MLAVTTALAQTNLAPVVDTNLMAKIKAAFVAVHGTNATNGSSSVVVVSNTPPAGPVFINRVPMKYSTNPVVWLEVVEYTDDLGKTWHHMAATVFNTNDETVVDTNAPVFREYMVSYTPAKR